MAKVLIVEDEKTLNEAYELVLKKAGYKVSKAYNGEEALELAKKEKPALILLDLRMPKMGGIDFLKELNPATNYPDTKVIIFSNYDNQDDIDVAFKSGASKYILKAWSSPSELVKVVQETLKK